MAVEAAWERFQTTLSELVQELRWLRAPVQHAVEVRGSVAKRMVLACWPHREQFITPMAAVAGAVAERVGKALLAETPQVIVENGGDVFLSTSHPRVAAVFAGASPLTGRIGIQLTRVNEPLGLCTSSGTVGPSLSFGRADAAIVLAGSAALADAAATALGNRIQTADDIERAVNVVRFFPGVLGAMAVVSESFGAWGEIELVRVEWD